MFRSLIAALVWCFISLSAFADGVGPTEQAEFQRIIAAQIAAFRADDGKAAYDFAAPVVRKIFTTPETFMAMVKQGYPQVYRPRSFNFTETLTDPYGRPAQKVTIVGPGGKTYAALYSMEKQPDGTWRIAACTLIEVPGLNA